MDRCPEKEIDDLRKMIMDERTLKDNVDQVFDKDFKVMSIRLIPLGLCAEQNTKTPKVHSPIQGTNNNVQNKAGPASVHGYTEYLVTFIIPAIVIVCMILVAGIIACVLYRRRRTGECYSRLDCTRNFFCVDYQKEKSNTNDSEWAEMWLILDASIWNTDSNIRNTYSRQCFVFLVRKSGLKHMADVRGYLSSWGV